MARLYINQIKTLTSSKKNFRMILSTVPLDTLTIKDIEDLNSSIDSDIKIHYIDLEFENNIVKNPIKDGSSTRGFEYDEKAYVYIFKKIEQGYVYLDHVEFMKHSTIVLKNEKDKCKNKDDDPCIKVNSLNGHFNFHYQVQTLGDTYKEDPEIQNLTFSITKVIAHEVQESKWYSNGDEIYFRIINFNNKNDSTQVGQNRTDGMRYPKKGFYRFKKKGQQRDINDISFSFQPNEYLKIKVWEEDLGINSGMDPDDHVCDFFVRIKEDKIFDLLTGSYNMGTKKNGFKYQIFYKVVPNFNEGEYKKTEEKHMLAPKLGTFNSIKYDGFKNKMDVLKNWVADSLKPEELTADPVEILSDKDMADIVKMTDPENSEDHERINEFIREYYESFLNHPALQDQYLEEILNSQYPVMAYPVFPEPMYYYLKRISNKFILSAVEAMPMNTMALFVNTPEFVEAFLCGMNTEMGKELLWREYPTDSRGSYFRKFWDTEIRKDIEEELLNNSFYDVEPVDQWSGKLGKNHTEGKDNLLIFAIKGEVLKKYPETMIFLSKGQVSGDSIKLKLENPKILPDLSAWLNEETFLVGFSIKLEDVAGDPATKDPGYFLTFMNKPSETRFAQKDAIDKKENAGLRAKDELVLPQAYGKHIAQFLTGWE